MKGGEEAKMSRMWAGKKKGSALVSDKALTHSISSIRHLHEAETHKGVC